MHRNIGRPRRFAIHPATADTSLLCCAQIASSDSCEFHAAAADGSDDIDGRSPRPKPATAPADSAGRATGSVVTQITLDSDSDDDGAADSGGGTGGRVSRIGSSSMLSSLSVSGAAASGSSRRESERCDISDDGSMAGDGGASPPAAPQPVVWCW